MLLSYFLRPPKSAEGGYAGTMGAQRCPVATDRTGIATAATCRWSWSSMAGYAGGALWNLVGFGHGGTGARVAKEISAVPDLPSSLPAMGAGGQVGTQLARAG